MWWKLAGLLCLPGKVLPQPWFLGGVGGWANIPNNQAWSFRTNMLCCYRMLNLGLTFYLLTKGWKLIACQERNATESAKAWASYSSHCGWRCWKRKKECGRNTKVLCFSKDTVSDIKEKILHVVAEHPPVAIVVHVGSNDIVKPQSQVLKQDFFPQMNKNG